MLVSAGRLRVSGKVVHPILSLVLVVVIFGIILPRVADLSSVWHVVAQMTWLELMTLLAISLWNLATYWIVLIRTVPGLHIGQAMVVTESSTALANALPGGVAFGLGVSYSMFASWGFDRATTALSMLYSGMADLFAKLSMPVAALILLALTGDASAGLIGSAVLGAVILVVSLIALTLVLRSDRGARRVGDMAGSMADRILRPFGSGPVKDWGDRVANFRHLATQTFQNRWHGIIAAGLLSHFSLFLVLLVSLRHVGVAEDEVGWVTVLGAFAFVRLLSALPLTPGGVGVVELGLTTALVVAGGERAQVLAAVLVFRALTYGLQIPFGVVTYLYWRHSKAWRTTHPQKVVEPAALGPKEP
jgi:uncharacterized membrane protein YbhN (UPF0104 family)